MITNYLTLNQLSNLARLSRSKINADMRQKKFKARKISKTVNVFEHKYCITTLKLWVIENVEAERYLASLK